MSGSAPVQEAADELPMPLPLLIAYAGRRVRDWHRLCWHIDERLARTVLTAKESTLGAIRLAWWEEALAGSTGEAPRDPLLIAWQEQGPTEGDRTAVRALASAWRALLDPAPMTEADWARFGVERGALFTLVARRRPDAEDARRAQLWALWDVARRDPDRQRAEGAFAAALALAGSIGGTVSRRLDRPLALAAAMALDDVRTGQLPTGGFSGRQYLRLVGRALLR